MLTAGTIGRHDAGAGLPVQWMPVEPLPPWQVLQSLEILVDAAEVVLEYGRVSAVVLPDDGEGCRLDAGQRAGMLGRMAAAGRWNPLPCTIS